MIAAFLRFLRSLFSKRVKSAAPVHASIVGIISRANLDAPKWEVIRQTRPLTDEDIAQHGPNCESGVMQSWSVPLDPPVDGRMFQPMRQRWDAEARIIYVERMA